MICSSIVLEWYLACKIPMGIFSSPPPGGGGGYSDCVLTGGVRSGLKKANAKILKNLPSNGSIF